MLSLDFVFDKDSWLKKLECLSYLSKHQVDVGLTSSASSRSRFLMGIHEHGSPIMHIPPRPVIGPGLSMPETVEAMGAAADEALAAAHEGDMAGTVAGLEASGQAGADGIRAYIDSGALPGNAPVTISGGWIFNRVARVGVYVSGKGGGKPLVETGALYNSFSYEIKAKG